MAKTRPDAKASAGKKKKVLKKGPPSSQIAKRSQILHRKGPFSSQPAQVDYVATEDHLLTLPNTVSFILDFFCYSQIDNKDLHLKLVECILLKLFNILIYYSLFVILSSVKC